MAISYGVVTPLGDGVAQLGADVVVIYQRAATQPVASSGTYDYAANTYTAPTGWTTTVPTGTDPLWMQVIQVNRAAQTLTSGGVVRVSGEGGSGIEHVFASHATVPLPANLQPDNDWGYRQPGTVQPVEAAEPTLAIASSGFFTGTSLALEPGDANRPQIQTAELLPSTGDRYFGQIRVYPDGRVDLNFVTARDDLLTVRADLSDAFESRGVVRATVAGDSFEVRLTGADTSDPYQWAASADVAAWYGRNGGRANNSIGASVDFELLSESSLTWTSAAPGVTATHPYLFRAARDIRGRPSTGAAVPAQWSTPEVVGRFGLDGPRGVAGATGSGVDVRLLLLRADTRPTISGGSWDGTTFTVPDGWSETVPAATSTGTPLWASFALLKTDPVVLAFTPVARFSVDPEDIPDRGINAATKLALRSITDTVIADNAIRTQHILALAVTAEKVAADAISARNILAGTIEASHMAAGTLSASNITAGTIRALVRFESPDIVAQPADQPRKYIRLFDGTLRFGDDGRVGAQVDNQFAAGDYVLLGKRVSGEMFEPPTWNTLTLPTLASSVSSAITLLTGRRYNAGASGAPSTHAGFYVRSLPRQLLAIDSDGDAWTGAMVGVGSTTLGPATATAMSGAEGLLQLGARVYRMDTSGSTQLTLSFARSSLEEPHVAAAFGAIRTTIRPRHGVFPSNRFWDAVLAGERGNARVWQFQEHAGGFLLYARSLYQEHEARVVDGGGGQELQSQTISDDRCLSYWIDTDAGGTAVSGAVYTLPVGDNRNNTAVLLRCSIRIGSEDRILSITRNGELWLSQSGVALSTLSQAQTRSEQRGRITFPVGWRRTYRNTGRTLIYDEGDGIDVTHVIEASITGTSGLIHLVSFGSDLVLLREEDGLSTRTYELWHFPLGSGNTEVNMTRLATFRSGENPRGVTVVDGTPWALLQDGRLVCIEIAGASVTWTAATPEEAHPNVPWNVQRDGRWRILSTQDSGVYPGSSTQVPEEDDPLLLFTALDGDQTLYLYRSAHLAWTRDGEGAHEGAPLRLVPVQKTSIAAPIPAPGPAKRRLYLNQEADGTLSWEP